MRSICTFLGKDFQANLDIILSQHMPLLCKDTSAFVNLVLKTFKDKSIEKMKTSKFIPRQLRMAVEVAPINSNTGLLGRMKSLMLKPLQVAMYSPPMIAACRTSNSAVVKAMVKKTIDQAFNSFCQEQNIPQSEVVVSNTSTPSTPLPSTPSATPSIMGGKRKTRKQNRKERKTRRRAH